MTIDLRMYKWKRLNAKSEKLSKRHNELMLKIGEVRRRQDFVIQEMNRIAVAMGMGSNFKLKDIFP